MCSAGTKAEQDQQREQRLLAQRAALLAGVPGGGVDRRGA
ncbi:hypothetical protein BH20ACT16_BH20ACT16_15420 [soil metagenome]